VVHSTTRGGGGGGPDDGIYGCERRVRLMASMELR
jgi:hypothetical protein